MKRLGISGEIYPTEAARCTFANKNDDSELVIVTVNEVYDNNPFQITALLLHESVHVKQWLMELIGENKPSPEFEAYTIQDIYQRLFEAYEKTRRKIFSEE